MSLILYAHPFSSYCWKALIALYEKGCAFDYRVIDGAHPDHGGELRALWPLMKFPVLVDGERPLIESSIIIEYLDLIHPGAARLLPADPMAALDIRFMDRVFDNHVMTPMNAIVRAHMRDPQAPDRVTVEKAEADLDTIYRWLETRLGESGGAWACGSAFTLADIAAAPALFYADWVRPIPESCPALRAYRARLLTRPTVARCVDEARPYRSYFPPGAPDRD